MQFIDHFINFSIWIYHILRVEYSYLNARDTLDMELCDICSLVQFLECKVFTVQNAMFQIE